MPLGNSNLPEFFGYLWVMDLRNGMGYWLSESMGYARKMPANQHGSPGNVWVTGEYGLSERRLYIVYVKYANQIC